MPLSKAPFEPLTIEAIVTHWASRSTHAPAVTSLGRAALDYGGLHAIVMDLRHQFRSRGIGQADRVALILGPGPSSVTAFLGVAACAAAVPLNPDSTRAEFEFSLQALRPRLLLVDSRLRTEVRSVALELGIPILEVAEETNGPAGRFRFGSFDETQRSQVIDHDRRVAPDDIAIVMHTSGSTGRPKCVPLTQEGICRSSWNTAQSLGLSDQDRCLNMLPMHHVHGLVSCILVPIAAGGCVVATAGFRADCLPQWLNSCQPTWYSASPPMHHTIVETLASTTALPIKTSLRFVRTGSMPLWPTLREGLAKTFAVPVVEAYGMTEVPHICGNPPNACRAGSVGQRIVAEWGIIDEAGQLLPAGQVGEVVVRGPTVTPGYLNDTLAHADVFKDGWFHTGDLGWLDQDGYLFLAGRQKEMINRGGSKVIPREIEEILLQHPSVRRAVAFAVDHPTLGEDVAAAIVSSDGLIHDESEMRRFVASQLAAFKVPSRIVQVDEIPVEASGKVNRWTLADRLARVLQTVYEPPVGELEPLIAAVFEHVLRLDRVGRNDHFFFLGGDSLTATRAISRLRDQLGVDLPQRSIFESPTVAELADDIQLMQSQAQSEGPRQGIPQLEHVGACPLSFAQQRLWFLERMEGPLTAYNLPYGWKLRGPLDVEPLRRALQEVVRRHEPLRTTFALIDEDPVQVIRPSGRFDLPVEDLRSWGSEEQEAEIHRRCRLEAEKPFDLRTDLMLRASLLRLAQDEHLLLLTFHHIASDGWSLRVLWRELETLYDAYCRGADANLPNLPVQYADYAVWQQNELEGQRAERLLEYWREQLAGVSVLELPTDHPRPAMHRYQGARYEFELPVRLVEQLQALAQAEGVTLHMLLLGAFQALLSRYSVQDDIAVGVPVAGRNRAELENLIGFFANTLVLRTDLSENPTFRELLGRIRQVSLAAYDHQDLPFEKLVEDLKPLRDLSRNPLVQVMFQLLNFSDQGLTLGDLEVSRLPSSSQRVRFDLELHLWQRKKQLVGVLAYSTDLFDHATIERMVGHFVTLLAGIAADADRRLSELPLLTDRERHQLVVEWNDSAVAYPREKCVHELFEEQVARSPVAIAVVFEDQELTYRELNERANQLAHDLIGLGVGPETLVGLCLERSPELIVGILGILKAGGAYVPLDPNDPAGRLAFMRFDAQLRLVLDRDDIQAAQSGSYQSRQSLPVRSKPEQLAYVMYTSGSTGEPKGVCVTHRGVVRLVKETNYVRLTASDRFLQYASPAFDASTFEIWGCLLNGGQLVLPPPGALSLDELGRLVRDHQITVLWLTAGVFHLMVEHGVEDLRGVRQLLAGGDVLSPTHVRRVLEQLPDTTVINGYGPTENTTFTCCHVMTSCDQVGATVSIGRPISSTQVYILDEHMQPVPIGVHGELCVGGDGLARGYHRRPELTAERFVPNPFGLRESRLYKTGDLARYRADGTIEFLGRRDDQVKIRGHRVELGEVEAALMRHPAVRQSAVIARADDSGDKQLIGYVVLSDTSITSDVMRNHLREQLPSYMVPTPMTVLDAMPLTPHGKIDRHALPIPEERVVAAGLVAPRDPLELQLTRIWEDVLKVRPIGVHDNFFELGGHSLVAVKLFDRISRVTGQNLPLATLFECPTIEHLARVLRDRNWWPAWTSLVPVQPTGSRPPLFLVPPAAGSVLRFTELARQLGQDQPVYGLEPLGHDGRHRPLDRVEDMASWYLKEIRELQPTGPYLLAGICFGGVVAWEMATQLHQQGEQVDLVAILDSAAPQSGPTWTTLRRSGKYFWQRTIHHWASGHLPKAILNKIAEPWRVVRGCMNPSRRRHRRMLNAHWKAQRSYLATHYSGNVLFLQSDEMLKGDLTRARWAELATGDFMHVVVPGTTHRDLLLDTDFTPTLAQILREHLDRALAEPPLTEPASIPFIRPSVDAVSASRSLSPKVTSDHRVHPSIGDAVSARTRRAA